METQKPLTAFIFANGSTDDGPQVRRELSTYPDAWIIAADGGARQAQYYGLHIHTTIGDLDSLDADEIAHLKAQGTEILQYPPEKNETDLELALVLAAQKQVNRIRIFSAIGDRLDQTLSNIYLMALPILRPSDVRLTAGKQQAWLIFPGDNLIHGADGDTVSLIPLAGEANSIRTKNLYYPLSDETLTFGPARGVSNVMQTDTAHVIFNSGVLLVVHTIGRA